MAACFSRKINIPADESPDLPIIHNGYWSGPFDVRVPNYVDWVMAEDGGMTEMACGGRRLTEADYKQKYAVKDSKGVWWYNKTHCDSWNKN